MDEVGVVVAIINALNSAGIPFMLVGSLSSNAYGIPRSTKDADLVIQLGNFPLGKLMSFLPREFRLEPQIGFETITSTTRSRVYYDRLPNPFTIELFDLSDDSHDQLRFSNRRETSWGGARAYIPRAEDVVITKLRWALAGKSREKDIEDAKNVLAVQKGKLDLEYIRCWCDTHGSLQLLDQLIEMVGNVPNAS